MATGKLINALVSDHILCPKSSIFHMSQLIPLVKAT